MQSHAHSQLRHHIQQPLFKLTNSLSQSQTHSTTASQFVSPTVNKSPYHGHQLNIRPVNSPSNSYFRPKSPRQKEKGKFICYNFTFAVMQILVGKKKQQQQQQQNKKLK